MYDHIDYEEIDHAVSLVEYVPGLENTRFSTNFAIQYYVDKINHSASYKVVHICSLLFDVDRLKSCTLNESILNSISIYQTTTLSQLHQLLNTIIYNTSTPKPQCIVIEDLDESFNISSFENYLVATKLITKIVRLIRKISQLFDVTCFLVQRRPRVVYNIKHSGRLVRSMVDNQIILNGDKCNVDSLYN